MTQQREIILEELKKFAGHPTADELFDEVKKRLSHVSLATVYRNLEILSGAGLISKIEISGRQKRFDSDLQQHTHVYCLSCHRVDNIELQSKSSIDFKAKDHQGYRIDGYRIEFKGFCPDCLTKTDNKGGKSMGCKKCGTSGLSEPQRKVLEALAKSKEPCAGKDIALVAGMEAKQVSCQITALKKKGYVASPIRCKYEITRDGQKALA
ncbi:MAG: transcriptional repressor [Desulfobulbaceae bacterium]|nr:transcriptional repressor [Desulfobulbaceae bacterium]